MRGPVDRWEFRRLADVRLAEGLKLLMCPIKVFSLVFLLGVLLRTDYQPSLRPRRRMRRMRQNNFGIRLSEFRG